MDGGGVSGKTGITLTESFLEDLDTTWQEESYSSREEFAHDVIRDAVKHPGFSRESWKEIAAVEHARRAGESEAVPREEIFADERDRID